MKHSIITTNAASEIKTVKTSLLPALGLSLVDATPKDAVDAVLARGVRNVFFMNAHCCNILQSSPSYKTAIQCADLLLPDGVGISLASKMTGQRLQANLNGTDLIPLVLKQAADQGKSVYLFGGKQGVAQKAADNLKRDIPHLQIAGIRDGYDGAKNTSAVIKDINNSRADILLVALGVPMQENWLHQNAHALKTDLNMGVGAAFDFFAGVVPRAPKIMRHLKSEWIWRFLMEPRRMARRYLVGNVTFLTRASRAAVRHVKTMTVVRRIMDVTISVSALMLLAPVFIATAFAIKSESKGPVFFTQTRIGKKGAPFKMIKFRSMVQNAEELRDGVLGTSDREGVCFKSRNDPRITHVGRFIRRASIDELPQVFNVLKGEMSIVGPRPALPSEVQAYPKRAYGRLAVKPGITGIWQVSGRADVGFDDMVEMDLAYAKSHTLLLDFILIALTFRAVISGNGAH